MDPVKPIEDQFSKLHPCLPVNTKVGIVGGGPSGLSAAYALSRLGYNDITIIEKYDTVGGMCGSVDIEGTNLDKFLPFYSSGSHKLSIFICFSLYFFFRKNL